MLKTMRDKVALGVFILLLLAGLGLCIAYISGMGHNLNVAASTIDDAAGELEGYTAIVYAGLAPDNLSEENSTSTKLNEQAQATSQETDETALNQLDEENSLAGADETPLTLPELRDSYLDKGAVSFVLDVENPTAYDERTVIRAGKYTFGLMSLTGEDTAASVLERIEVYEAAEVDFIIAVTPSLALLDNLTYEAQVEEAKYNLAQETAARAKAQTAATTVQTTNSSPKQTSATQANGVAEVDDPAASQATGDKEADETVAPRFFSVQDFSIVISCVDEGLLPGGVTVDGVFYDDAALTSELGTILISPAKLITARDISIYG